MKEVGWESMSTRRKIHKLTLYYKIVNNCSPSYLSDLLPFQVCQSTQHKLRNSIDYSLFACRTEQSRKSFFPSTKILWNNLSNEIRSIDSITHFKNILLSIFDICNPNPTLNFANDLKFCILLSSILVCV